MKYKVLNEFIDRHTQKYHPSETEYETDSEDWANYLIELGFLEGEVKKSRGRGKKDENQ